MAKAKKKVAKPKKKTAKAKKPSTKAKSPLTKVTKTVSKAKETMAKTKKKEQTTGVPLIGETAGAVWLALEGNGQISVAQLGKQVDVPKDLLMQAIGWLAREDKIRMEESGRKRMISLR